MSDARQFFWLLILLVFSSNASAYGLGAGPSTLDVRLGRSAHVNETISVSTSSSEIVRCDLSKSGDTEEWMSLYNDTLYLNPKSQQDFKVGISVPYDAPNDNYSGRILIASRSAANVAGFTGLVVTSSVLVKTMMRVTGFENRTYNVTRVHAPSRIMEGGDLPLEITVVNNGNIWVIPVVEASILDGSGSVKYRMRNTSGKIHPPSRDDINFILPAGRLHEGEYLLDVTVTWRNERLWSGAIPFQIIKEGVAETISGELVGVEVDESDGNVGEPVTVRATFRNTGDVAVNATLKLNFKHNQLQEAVDGGSKTVQPGEEAVFTLSYTPEDHGIFEVEGVAEYSGLETTSINQVFMIRKPEMVEGRESMLPYLVLAIILLATALILYLRSKRRGEKAT